MRHDSYVIYEMPFTINHRKWASQSGFYWRLDHISVIWLHPLKSLQDFSPLLISQEHEHKDLGPIALTMMGSIHFHFRHWNPPLLPKSSVSGNPANDRFALALKCSSCRPMAHNSRTALMDITDPSSKLLHQKLLSWAQVPQNQKEKWEEEWAMANTICRLHWSWGFNFFPKQKGPLLGWIQSSSDVGSDTVVI